LTVIERSSSLVLFVFLLVSLAQGTTEKTIYAFENAGSGDGMYPYFSPVFDEAGNMYGATLDGGTSNAGMILELSPGAKGDLIKAIEGRPLLF
jgi:hypothetical protein